MRIVAALGDNALPAGGQGPDAGTQAARVVRAAEALAPLARAHELAVTHGGIPQAGLPGPGSAAGDAQPRRHPYDVLDAECQGVVGYWLLRALHNALPGRRVGCLLNQTVVSANDPAFTAPSGGAVPSPEPHAVVEADLVRLLLEAGTVTVCGGGGGIPVVEHADGTLTGVEAVVDKDLTAALLAEQIKADMLLILTDVPNVVVGRGTPDERPLYGTTPRELRSHSFPPGSMGPKVEAAARFVERTGGVAAIGALDDVAGILRGTGGTLVRPDHR